MRTFSTPMRQPTFANSCLTETWRVMETSAVVVEDGKKDFRFCFVVMQQNNEDATLGHR
jgi:hypothetical protein